MKAKSGFNVTEPGWLMQDNYYEASREGEFTLQQMGRNLDCCFDSYMIKRQDKGRER